MTFVDGLLGVYSHEHLVELALLGLSGLSVDVGDIVSILLAVLGGGVPGLGYLIVAVVTVDVKLGWVQGYLLCVLDKGMYVRTPVLVLLAGDHVFFNGAVLFE